MIQVFRKSDFMNFSTSKLSEYTRDENLPYFFLAFIEKICRILSTS